MAAYYPAFLDLRDKPVVVVGGGLVAERKVVQLVAAGAAVTVISPAVTDPLRALAAGADIRVVDRAYQPGDVLGARLAIAATDDLQVNRTVANEARAAGIMVNAVDDVEFCDFIAPAVVEQGDITLAISTGGKSPAMARFLRRQLEAFLTEEFAALLSVAEEVRGRLRSERRAVSPETWQDALDAEVRRLVRAGDQAAAKTRLYENLTGAGVMR